MGGSGGSGSHAWFSHYRIHLPFRTLMKGRYIFGLLILIFGVGMFVERLGYIDVFDLAFDALFTWWPVLLIIYGVNELIQNPRKITAPLISIVLGVVFLADNVYDIDLWAFILPSALIVLGLSMLIRKPKRFASRERAYTFSVGEGSDEAGSSSNASSTNDRYSNANNFSSGYSENYDDDVRFVSDNSIAMETTLNEGKFVVTSQSFTNGRGTVLLGSMVVDFRRAVIAPGGATLMIECTLGSAEIVVPAGWNVSVLGTIVMGSIHSLGAAIPMPAADKPRLTIDISGALAEVKIRYV
jgi:predicted membrane protein